MLIVVIVRVLSVSVMILMGITVAMGILIAIIALVGMVVVVVIVGVSDIDRKRNPVAAEAVALGHAPGAIIASVIQFLLLLGLQAQTSARIRTAGLCTLVEFEKLIRFEIIDFTVEVPFHLLARIGRPGGGVCRERSR
jgi:hypothetical protein